MTYICECCGKEQNDWPALKYDSPDFYNDLSAEEKNDSSLTPDLCIAKKDGATFYFIRGVLVQNVIDGCQNLEYGVWVSLSEKSFNEYVDQYDNKKFTGGYFGWLANYLSDYDKDSIPTDVEIDNSIGRPYIWPHSSFDHQLVKDCYEGISKEEAEKRIEKVLNN